MGGPCWAPPVRPAPLAPAGRHRRTAAPIPAGSLGQQGAAVASRGSIPRLDSQGGPGRHGNAARRSVRCRSSGRGGRGGRFRRRCRCGWWFLPWHRNYEARRILPPHICNRIDDPEIDEYVACDILCPAWYGTGRLAIHWTRPVSLPRCQAQPMIDVGTIAGLHEHGHQLAAFCPHCDAWRVVPLGEWVSQGRGSKPGWFTLTRESRCGDSCWHPAKVAGAHTSRGDLDEQSST
jgi:hypothetical protein